jgi:hypothetical protein
LTSLLLSWLTKRFPRKSKPHHTAVEHRFRNQVIGWASVCFMVLGAELPLLIQGKSAVPSTWSNGAFILSGLALGAIGGTALMANLLGDRGARNYLEYCEQQTGIAASGFVLVSKVLVCAALLALAAALMFTFF